MFSDENVASVMVEWAYLETYIKCFVGLRLIVWPRFIQVMQTVWRVLKMWPQYWPILILI